MKVVRREFHGIEYLVPDGFYFIEKDIDDYPAFCGAGKGIGDKIVPEFIGGMRVSHICHPHDDSWEKAKDTLVDFTVSNMLFAYNLLIYLSSGSGSKLKRRWRGVKGSIYVLAVSTIGWRIFKRLKRDET